MIYDGKNVLSLDEFTYAKAQIGDYVEQEVVDDAMDCLPPACMGRSCSQMGEPCDSQRDPNTGKWRMTYHTFKKVSGVWPNKIWQYCGRCFCGETVERGDPLPVVKGGAEMIDTHPKVCNLCGGKVILCSNAQVYHGREYGSGLCYYCLKCGAYVGTHKPRPQEAMGLLADEPMRRGKKMCHALFDPLWQGKEPARQARVEAYRWLAGEMGIALEDCHFGHFNIHQLRQAYRILQQRCGKSPR